MDCLAMGLPDFFSVTTNGDKNFDPLDWWRLNKNSFSRISKLARNVLALQASSVPSESAFSIAGNTFVANRSSLSHPSFRALMLLKSWVNVDA